MLKVTESRRDFGGGTHFCPQPRTVAILSCGQGQPVKGSEPELVKGQHDQRVPPRTAQREARGSVGGVADTPGGGQEVRPWPWVWGEIKTGRAWGRDWGQA